MLELPVHPLAIRKMRSRCMHLPMRPFQLFTGPKNLALILEGTGIDPAEVMKHSHQIVDGLWCFNVARSYENNAIARGIHGLVSIANAGEGVLGTGVHTGRRKDSGDTD